MPPKRSKRMLGQRTASPTVVETADTNPMVDDDRLSESYDSTEHSSHDEVDDSLQGELPSDDGEGDAGEGGSGGNDPMSSSQHDAQAEAASPFDSLPPRMREVISREGLTLQEVEKLTAEDLKVFLGFSLREVLILRDHLAKAHEGQSNLPESSPKRQRLADSQESKTLSQDKWITKVPTTYPEALPKFNDDARRNPLMWFTGFENSLVNLRYHTSTWLAILTMATKSDREASEWVTTLLNTSNISYDMLKENLVSSFQTPILVQKEYERLLAYRMKPGLKVTDALSYHAGFVMQMLRAGKTETIWPDWHFHYQRGLCPPWSAKYAQKVADGGEPSTLYEAQTLLTTVGRVIEAGRPEGLGHKTTEPVSTIPMDPMIPPGARPAAPPPPHGAGHIATEEERNARFCGWHGHSGHRTITCSEWKRWCAGWRNANQPLGEDQKVAWLNWIEQHKCRPNVDPPAPVVGEVQPPRGSNYRDMSRPRTGCYRCGVVGHIAANCMAVIPPRPYGQPSLHPAPQPYGSAYAPLSSPTPASSHEGLGGFAHPSGQKRLPPLPPLRRRGPSPPPPDLSHEDTDPTIRLLNINKEVELYFLRNLSEMSQHEQAPMSGKGLQEVIGLVDNFQVRMLIDPGATHSVLSYEWAEKHELLDHRRMTNVVGHSIGKESTPLKFEGRTAELSVSCQGNHAMHSFLLMRMKDRDPECLVGDDLMAKLGYYVTNVNFKLPKAARDLLPEGSDTDPSYDRMKDDLRTRACTPHPRREEVIAAVEGLLEKLEGVTGFCTCKEALVDIPIPDDIAAPYVPQYKTSHEAVEKITTQVADWAKAGRIVPTADAEGNNPLTPATKRHPVTGEKSEIRTCLDIRRVNDILKSLGIKVPNNLPKIKDLFDKLSHKRIITIVDIADAFPSMPVTVRSRRFLRFTWGGRRWEFVGAPFGLLFLTAQFQNLMMSIFADLMESVIVFVDDLIICSASVEEHISLLQEVFGRLYSANLKVRAAKCQIGFLDIFMLGHKAGVKGVEVDRRKLMGMENWLMPTAKTIEHYLGLFNYFRDFIPRYAEVMSPLEKVRKNFSWGQEQEISWSTAKRLLMEAPVLHHPDWGKKMYVGTDGCTNAVSAVLFQARGPDTEVVEWVGKNNRFLSMSHKTMEVRIIAFASRATTGTEKWYSAYKLELLAVVFALERFRNFLMDKEFTLFTDQRALVWLFREQKLQRTNRTIQSWLDDLLEYKFEVIHCPGVRNVLPDVLSRIHATDSEGDEVVGLPRERSLAPPMFKPLGASGLGSYDQPQVESAGTSVGSSLVTGSSSEWHELRTGGDDTKLVGESTEGLLERSTQVARCPSSVSERNELHRQPRVEGGGAWEEGGAVQVYLMDLERSYDLSPLDAMNWRMLPSVWNEIPRELQATIHMIFGKAWDVGPTRTRINGLVVPWKAVNCLFIPYGNEELLLTWLAKAVEEAAGGVTSVLILPKHEQTIWFQSLKSQCQSYDFRKQRLSLFVLTPRAAYCLEREHRPRILHLKIQEKVTAKMVEDPEEQRRLIREHHERSHSGTRGVFLSISNDGHTWPNMLKQIREYVSECSECHIHTLKHEGYHPLTFVEATFPMDHVAIDTAHMPVDAEGYAYVLVIVDIATRFLFLRALQQASGSAVGRELFKLFCEVGFPKIIQSDNGPEFRNSVIRELMLLAEVKHRFSTPYHPRGNGSAEAGVKRMKEIVRKKLQGADTLWREQLPAVQYGANLRVMNVHKSRPFSLFYARAANPLRDYSAAGSRMLTQAQLQQRLKDMTELVFPIMREVSHETHEQLKELFQRGGKITHFPDGAMVVVRPDVESGGKLTQRYEGPYKVVERTRGGSYRLAEGDGTLLRRNYAPSQLRMIQLPTEDLPQTYEVEEIRDCRRTSNGELEYEVKWKGYSEMQNTWEPAENFQDRTILQRYHELRRKMGHIL